MNFVNPGILLCIKYKYHFLADNVYILQDIVNGDPFGISITNCDFLQQWKSWLAEKITWCRRNERMCCKWDGYINADYTIIYFVY